MRVVMDAAAQRHLAADGVTRARLDVLLAQGRVTLVAEQGDDLAEQAAAMADALVAGAWRTRARAERLSERLAVMRPAAFAELLARVPMD